MQSEIASRPLAILVFGYFILSFIASVDANEFNTLTEVQFGKDESMIRYPLLGQTQRDVQIQFNRTYSAPPEVLIYVTLVSATKTSNQDYRVGIFNKTSDGFMLRYSSTSAGNTVKLRVMWMSFETSSDVELIYVDAVSPTLQESASSSYTRTYIQEQKFKNSYSEPPRIAIFLNGLRMITTGSDTVGFSLSDTTTTQTTVAVSIWESGQANLVSYVMFIAKREIADVSNGSQVNLNSGSVDYSQLWTNSAGWTRQLTKSQTTKNTISDSTAENNYRFVFTGFRGYDVRSNLVTILEITNSTFTNNVYTQKVQTYDSGTVVQGYWDTVQVNTNTSSYEELTYSWWHWWWVLIFLFILFLIIALIICLCYCCKRKSSSSSGSSDTTQNKENQPADDSNLTKMNNSNNANDDTYYNDQSNNKSKVKTNNFDKDNGTNTSGYKNDKQNNSDIIAQTPKAKQSSRSKKGNNFDDGDMEPDYEAQERNPPSKPNQSPSVKKKMRVSRYKYN